MSKNQRKFEKATSCNLPRLSMFPLCKLINENANSHSPEIRGVKLKGIPFAKPPIGDERFREPKIDPWPKWDGTRDSTYFRPACMQPEDLIQNADRLGLIEKLKKDIDYSEDCLFLNVYVPDGRVIKGAEWPVVIWLHPGDFSVGIPNIWDGSVLAIKQKIIVVTASYRLNIFGFLATTDNVIPGNVGLLDQVAVMKWVQEHIKYFNGSKNDVNLWGHSAGAVSVSVHLISGLSTNIFQRAVMMSGNFLTPNTIKNPMSMSNVSEGLDCNDSGNVLKCLRTLKAEDLVRFARDYEWGPTIATDNAEEDYIFIKMDPEKLLETDFVVNSVPIMAGYTDIEDVPIREISSEMEFKNIIKQSIDSTGIIISNEENETCLHDNLLEESIFFFYTPAQPPDDKKLYLKKYTELLTEHKYASGTFKLGKYTSRKNDTFLYRFDYKLKTTGIGDSREYPGVPQQHELPFFWGMPYWATLSPQIAWNTQDKRTSDIIMGLFGNFTRNSRPIEQKKTIQWDPLDITNPRIFIIDKNPNMSDAETFDYKPLSFWNDYYPKIKSQVKQCCSLTSKAIYLFPTWQWVFLSVLLKFL